MGLISDYLGDGLRNPPPAVTIACIIKPMGPNLPQTSSYSKGLADCSCPYIRRHHNPASHDTCPARSPPIHANLVDNG
jgi:hypothetical protein